MIAGKATLLLPDQLAGGVEDENAAELPGIPLDADLSRPGPAGLAGGRKDTRIENAYPTSTQPSGPVGAQGGIRIELEGDAGLGTKPRGLCWRTVTDADENRPGRADLRRHVAQLCDLLAAEDSAEVAHVDEHCRPVAQDVAQGDLASFAVLDTDAIEAGEIHSYLR